MGKTKKDPKVVTQADGESIKKKFTEANKKLEEI